MLKSYESKKIILVMAVLGLSLSSHGQAKSWWDVIKGHARTVFVRYPTATKCGSLLAGCGVVGALYWYYKQPLVFRHNFNGSMPQDVYNIIAIKDLLTEQDQSECKDYMTISTEIIAKINLEKK